MATQSEIAEHLDLGERQIRNLISDGTLPDGAGPGQLDLAACRLAYIRALRQQGARSRPGSVLDKERVRLARAQATRAERENTVQAGELMSIDHHVDFVVDLASEFVRSLSALPGRLAGELAATTNPAVVRARLLDEIGTIRNILAERCGAGAERIVELRAAMAEAEAE